MVERGEFCLLVAGAPPPWKDEMSRSEYAKYGITYEYTGDSSDDQFEEYRAAFNAIMLQAINGKYGVGFLFGLTERVNKILREELGRRKSMPSQLD
jgi:hypothetical protein